MAHKYLVDLTGEEQGYLLNLINKGKPAARKVARAHVLLRAAEGRPTTRLRKRSISALRPSIAPANALSMKA
jgi:hypothetical protein